MNKKEFNKKYMLNLNVSIEDKINDIKKLNNNSLSFYRYYSLKDKYTIENILNSIVHFSDPLNLNDPFECCIGLEIDEFLNSNFKEKVINKIFLNDSKNNDFSFSKYTEGNEENILKEIGIDELLSSNNICKEKIFELFVKKIKEKLRTYIYPLFVKLKIDYDDFFDFLCKSDFIKRKLNEKKYIPLFAENFVEDLNEFYKILENYCDINHINKNKMLKAKEEFNKLIYVESKNIILKYMRGFKIFCLTTSFDNILMWSHYANQHNGICIEYDFSYIEEEFLKMLFPINYSSNRPMLKMYQLNPKYVNKIFQSIFVKSMEWKYESEWRLLIPNQFLDNNNNYRSPKIKTIYFGTNVLESEYKKIKKKIQNYDSSIKCIRLKMNYKKYKLDIIDN